MLQQCTFGCANFDPCNETTRTTPTVMQCAMLQLTGGDIVAHQLAGLRHRLRCANIQALQRPVALLSLHRKIDLYIVEHQAAHALCKQTVGRPWLQI